ncbi:MAG: hypothetical protein FWD01_03300, partial [Defluviitaleaceae bacterium]|nr:hypothetical protein [Defluviitaleaceae bacterium]
MPSNFLKHISIGLIISIFVLFIFSFFNNIIFEEIFLYETVPHYNYDANWRISQIFNFDSNFGDTAVLSDEILKEFIITDIAEISETQAETSEIPSYTIIGLSTVIFEVGTEYEDIQSVIDTQIPQPYNLADLTDLDTLRS